MISNIDDFLLAKAMAGSKQSDSDVLSKLSWETLYAASEKNSTIMLRKSMANYGLIRVSIFWMTGIISFIFPKEVFSDATKGRITLTVPIGTSSATSDIVTLLKINDSSLSMAYGGSSTNVVYVSSVEGCTDSMETTKLYHQTDTAVIDSAITTTENIKDYDLITIVSDKTGTTGFAVPNTFNVPQKETDEMWIISQNCVSKPAVLLNDGMHITSPYGDPNLRMRILYGMKLT